METTKKALLASDRKEGGKTFRLSLANQNFLLLLIIFHNSQLATHSSLIVSEYYPGRISALYIKLCKEGNFN